MHFRSNFWRGNEWVVIPAWIHNIEKNPSNTTEGMRERERERESQHNNIARLARTNSPRAYFNRAFRIEHEGYRKDCSFSTLTFSQIIIISYFISLLTMLVNHPALFAITKVGSEKVSKSQRIRSLLNTSHVWSCWTLWLKFDKQNLSSTLIMTYLFALSCR